jgi:hypothetical protein
MLIGAAASVPEIVTAAETRLLDSGTPDWSTNENAFGVVSPAAIVVVENVSEIVPIVSVVFTVLELAAADVCCTQTVAPLPIEPFAAVNVAVQPID